jgi:ABC-2 type transport system permease protein
MLVLAYIVSALFTALFFGMPEKAAALSVSDGVVKIVPAFLHVAKRYLLNSVNIIVMASLAFAISSLIRSSALAIGISMFTMFCGNIVNIIMSQAGLDWGRFLIFANTNLGSIVEGQSSYANHSPTFALIVIAVHMFIFLLTAWDGFIRREV